MLEDVIQTKTRGIATTEGLDGSMSGAVHSLGSFDTDTLSGVQSGSSS